MSILISAMSSTPRDFTDAENAAIDAHSVSLSQGNWIEHLDEVFFPAKPENREDLDAVELDHALGEFASYHAGKTGLSDHIKWHLALAEQLRTLIATGLAHGCDRVGIAG